MPRLPAKLTGVARYLPPRLLTNADLEKMVDTTSEWIFERTGIHQRHIVDKGVASSHLATEAARQLLEEKKVSPDEIDMIVVATVTPDMFFPSTACLVQNNLKCRRAWGFDLVAACSGFVYALTVAAQFVAAGSHKKALVIGADVMTSILNFEDRATCVLFGDGAGAVLVEPCQPGEEGILDFHHDIDGSGGCFLYMPAGGSLNPASHETVDKKMHTVHQEGREVFKYAVRRMVEVPKLLLERNGFSANDLKLLVPHQANQRIIKATANRLGLEDSRVVLNIDKYGNTTAGTIPIALVDALNEGRLKKDDLVMLLAVGAGYTTGALLLRWAY
ncbi:ketoacyl-ACP synthase III [Acidobacteriia bacterium AH_259_A11_L15]|nr:ketoacyl-ACP synthase III [Acidobacteriia bacterium AH_259_A11_L15]